MTIQLTYDGQLVAYPTILSTTNETTIATGGRASRELVGIWLCNVDNTNSVNVTISVTFTATATTIKLMSEFYLGPSGATQVTNVDIPFRDGDLLKVQASAANDLHIVATVRETLTQR